VLVNWFYLAVGFLLRDILASQQFWKLHRRFPANSQNENDGLITDEKIISKTSSKNKNKKTKQADRVELPYIVQMSSFLRHSSLNEIRIQVCSKKRNSFLRHSLTYSSRR
jgi:hypothetical protein